MRLTYLMRGAKPWNHIPEVSVRSSDEAFGGAGEEEEYKDEKDEDEDEDGDEDEDEDGDEDWDEEGT